MIDRIKEVIEYSQLSASAFADTIGISRSGLTHLLTGRNQPSLDVARKILAKFPEVSTEWLIMGMGEMLRADELTHSVVAEPADSPESSYLAENSKFDTQTDLFGEYDNPDDSDEDMVDPRHPDTEDTPVDSDADNEPVLIPQPLPSPEPEQVPSPPAPTHTPVTRARTKPVAAPVKRDKHQPVAQEKKLQKIVFFYDDHSFEVYS